MVQSDILEVSNQQSDLRFKLQEASGLIEGLKARLEEAVQRLTNREKEQSALQL